MHSGIDVKLYVEPEDEIRRIVIEAGITFVALRARVSKLIGRYNFRVFWRDTEGDDIVCESDGELDDAVRSCKDTDPLRLYIRTRKPASPATKEFFTAHPGVACGICGGKNFGARYRWPFYRGFDLCKDCHRECQYGVHDMLATGDPKSTERKNIFIGNHHGFSGGFGSYVERHGCGLVNSIPLTRRSFKSARFAPPLLKSIHGTFVSDSDKRVELNVDTNHLIRKVLADVQKKVCTEPTLEEVASPNDGDAEKKGAQERQELEQIEWTTPLRRLAATVASSPDRNDEVFEAVIANATAAGHMVAESLMDMSADQPCLILEDQENGWTHLDLEADTVQSQQLVKQQSSVSITSKDGPYSGALRNMEEMGFTNERNLLRILLEKYNGDISRVLDTIS